MGVLNDRDRSNSQAYKYAAYRIAKFRARLTDFRNIRKLQRLLESCSLNASLPVVPSWGDTGCLPFVRLNQLGRPLNNGKGFPKISKRTE